MPTFETGLLIAYISVGVILAAFVLHRGSVHPNPDAKRRAVLLAPFVVMAWPVLIMWAWTEPPSTDDEEA